MKKTFKNRAFNSFLMAETLPTLIPREMLFLQEVVDRILQASHAVMHRQGDVEVPLDYSL